MGSGQRVYLASASQRRRELVQDLGFDVECGPSGVDDGMLEPGQSNPTSWVMALAFLKASAGARAVTADGGFAAVIGADTVCLSPDGEVFGQPATADAAEQMIRTFRGRTHRVLTGVAFVRPGTSARELFVDSAEVSLGDVGEDEIAAYVTSGLWSGKAGAYNYAERAAAGWPLACEGDITSVMGLPVGLVRARLTAFLGRCAGGAGEAGVQSEADQESAGPADPVGGSVGA